MIVFLKKPADKSELIAAVEYFQTTTLWVFLFEENKRITEREIRKWKELDNVILKFKIFRKAVFTRQELLNEIADIKDCKQVGLPLGNHRVFYKIMPKLKSLGYTTIHFSDGVNDCFSLSGFLLSVKVKGVLGFIKSVYSYFEYKKSVADFCFYQLYPLKSCFSKVSLPPKLEKNNMLNTLLIKEINDKQVDTLILPGFGETTESLISFFNIKTNYCATSKEKELNINGLVRPIKNSITAEDVIRSGRIKHLFGTASSACFFAKNYDSNIDCNVMINGKLNENQGRFAEYFFVKYGNKLGIKFHQELN